MNKRVSLREQLVTMQQKVHQHEASTLYRRRAVYHDLLDAGKDKMMASGVIITITALGGRQIVPPVMIADGLSADTIAALQRDVQASHEMAIQGSVIVNQHAKGTTT